MKDGRVAVLTAAGSGMGASAARKLADSGYRVAILSSSGKGEALAEELGGVGVTGSNRSNDDLKTLVDKAIAAWGRIDVLVNSAGHGPRAPVLDLTDEDWRAGLAAYTKLFADTYAPDNIRMNNVLPGFIDSFPEQDELRRQIPMKRYGTTAEIAETIAFLASPGGAYITGQNLRVDGGLARSV